MSYFVFSQQIHLISLKHCTHCVAFTDLDVLKAVVKVSGVRVSVGASGTSAPNVFSKAPNLLGKNVVVIFWF